MAWAELACRRAQLAELKHKEKFLPKVDTKKQCSLDPCDDAHLYLGLSATRGMLAVSPELEAWVGKELALEYFSMRERRKALDERRSLATGKPPPGEGKP